MNHLHRLHIVELFAFFALTISTFTSIYFFGGRPSGIGEWIMAINKNDYGPIGLPLVGAQLITCFYLSYRVLTGYASRRRNNIGHWRT